MGNEKQNNSLFDEFVSIEWEKLWEKVNTDGRYTVECDDAESYMHVALSCDGDVHLMLDRGRNQYGFQPTFRSRTFGGGGRNHRVRKALLMLALAIEEDNEENNKSKWTIE